MPRVRKAPSRRTPLRGTRQPRRVRRGVMRLRNSKGRFTK